MRGKLILAMALIALAPTPVYAQFAFTITEAITANVRHALAPSLTFDEAKIVSPVSSSTASSQTLQVYGMDNGTISVWSTAEGREVRRFPVSSIPIIAVHGADQGSTALVIDERNSAFLVSLLSGEVRHRFAGPATGEGAISAAGDTAVSLLPDGRVEVWRKGEAPLFVAAGANPTSLEIDEAGTTLLVLSNGSVQAVPIGAIADADLSKPILLSDGADKVAIWAHDPNSNAFAQRASYPASAGAASSNTADLLAVGDGGSVKLYRLSDGSFLRDIELQEGDRVLALDEAGRTVQIKQPNGAIRVASFEKEETVATVVMTHDGWGAVAPNGQYDGDGDALTAISWATDDEEVKIDQLSESHYSPGVLTRAVNPEVKTASAGETLLFDVSESFSLPPSVTIEANDTETGNAEFELEFEVQDEGGLVAEIRVYQNDKLVFEEFFEDPEVGTVEREVDLQLTPGANYFRVVALNEDFIESEPAVSSISYSAQQAESDLYVVGIGIDEYRNPNLNLNYGVIDATAIKTFFEGSKKTLFRNVNTVLVTNADATKEGITDASNTLRNIRPQDVVVIYYAGHGETVSDEWYLLPHEIAYPEREDEITGKGIPSAWLYDWLKDIPAQKVVMFMDACKSGAAALKFRGFSERRALMQLARSSGIHVIAAAGKDQFASEVEALGHGAFTHTVLRALDGSADANGDSFVTVRELTFFIENELPIVSEENGARAQFPVINSKGQDFPIVALAN